MTAFLHIQFGFTRLGLLTVLLPLLPNLLWAAVPSHYRKEGKLHCGKVWENLESVTRILFIIGFLLFAGSHFKSLLLPLIAALFLLLYYWRWILYFFRRCDPEVLRRPLLGLPAPMAVLPTVYFLLMAIWFQSLPVLVSVLVFGVCHIRNTLSLKI